MVEIEGCLGQEGEEKGFFDPVGMRVLVEFIGAVDEGKVPREVVERFREGFDAMGGDVEALGSLVELIGDVARRLSGQ